MTRARETPEGRARIVAALEGFADHLDRVGDPTGARRVRRRKARYEQRLRWNLKPTPKARELPRLESGR